MVCAATTPISSTFSDSDGRVVEEEEEDTTVALRPSAASTMNIIGEDFRFVTLGNRTRTNIRVDQSSNLIAAVEDE